MSLTRYWVLEHQLVADGTLSQERYDDSDWMPVYQAEDVRAVLKEMQEFLESVMWPHDHQDGYTCDELIDRPYEIAKKALTRLQEIA